MKKFLLSIFAVLFAFAGAQAQETKTVELLPSHLEGKGTSGTGSEMEYTIAPITFVFSKGYGASGNMRAYKSSTITISGATIKSVNFTATSSYNPDMTVNTGSVSKNGTTSTWTGEAASVEFTVGAQLRATSILVTYVESSVATPVVTFEGDAGAFEDKITVNVSSEAPAYYTLNGETPDENSDLCPSVLTIKADATLRVVAIKDGERSALVTQEFKKAISGESASYATVVEDVASISAGDKIAIVASTENYAMSTTQNNNNRGQIEVEKSGDGISYVEGLQVITLEEGAENGTFAFWTGSKYLYAAGGTAKNNYLKEIDTKNITSSWTVSITDKVASIVCADNNVLRNTLMYNNTNGIFSCYASGQQDVSIYKVNEASIEAYTLTVGNAGWATLYLNYDAEIPTGVTCYAVSAVDGEYATLAEVEGVIPANTGVIVEAEAGSYTFEVATEAGSDVANELRGTTVNKYIFEDAYVLGVVDGVVGLYKAQMAGGVWLNNANKAYLVVPGASEVASYSFRFGEGTTGISEVKGESGNVKGIYDLTGRRVETITAPGIYVVNGKKVLVK